MTRGELRRLNQQLAAVGRKICACCGRQLALEAFAITGRGGTYRRAQCRHCFKVITQEKYTPAPTVKHVYNQRYYAKNRGKILDQMRAKYQERKRQQAFALLSTHARKAAGRSGTYHNTLKLSVETRPNPHGNTTDARVDGQFRQKNSTNARREPLEG